MTWKQALLKSIEKWDGICFDGESVNEECSLCIRAGMGNHTNANCKLCPIGLTTKADSCNQTSFYEAQRGDFNAKMHMYLFLCMLYHEYYGEDSQ